MKRKMIITAVGILMVCLLPLAAFAQSGEWQSTSTLPGSGSAYSSQVTAVGATTVESQAATAGSSPLRVGRGPRKDGDFNETGESGTGDGGSPVGSPLVLLSFAVVGAAVIYLRRRKVA